MTIRIKLDLRKTTAYGNTTWGIYYNDRLLHSWAGEAHVYQTKAKAQWWINTISRDIAEYGATLQENSMGQMSERIPLPE